MLLLLRFGTSNVFSSVPGEDVLSETPGGSLLGGGGKTGWNVFG